MSEPDQPTGDADERIDPPDPAAGEQQPTAPAASTRELHTSPRRARRAPARRRGRVISEGGVVDDDDQPRTATVRSEAHEGPAGPPQADAPPEPGGVLDASGQLIGADMPEPHAAPPAGDPAAAAQAGRMVDPGVFVVVAARAYLDGLDTYGADHPVTVDRLAALRRTLDVYAGEA